MPTRPPVPTHPDGSRSFEDRQAAVTAHVTQQRAQAAGPEDWIALAEAVRSVLEARQAAATKAKH